MMVEYSERPDECLVQGGKYMARGPPKKTICSSDSTRQTVEIWSVNQYIRITISAASGAMYMENGWGPNAEPCGTPVSTWMWSEEHDLHLTIDRLELRWDYNQSSTAPVRPYVCHSQSINVTHNFEHDYRLSGEGGDGTAAWESSYRAAKFLRPGLNLTTSAFGPTRKLKLFEDFLEHT